MAPPAGLGATIQKIPWDHRPMVSARQRQLAVRVLDSYASLLALLLANFLLLELVDDRRWGAIGSRHRQVSFETVLGALCAYVLVGLVFAFSFLAVNEFGGDFFAQPGDHSQSEYVYFSFVALTTLGFGDLSPVPGLRRR